MRSLTVLAAEDSAVNRMVLAAALKGAGHDVTLVEDGNEAVRCAREFTFDALLMDVSMPGLDGDAALRRIREDAARSGRQCPPAIALTGYTDAERRAALRQAGFAAVISKPYRIDALLSALGNAIATENVIS
jgi:CheY-like chemotaxis protein